MRKVASFIAVALLLGAGLWLWRARGVAETEAPRNDREPVVDAPTFEPVAAPPQGGLTLVGVVRDASGAPVPNALVSLAPTDQPSLTTATCGHCGERLLSCKAPSTALTVSSIVQARQGVLQATATATSNAQGHFRFERLGGVSFTVWARAAGHGVGLKERAAPGDPVEVYLPESRTVGGVVRDEKGGPVRGVVRVVSQRLAEPDEVETDATGRFSVGELGEGPFFVVASAVGLLPSSAREVEAGREVVLTLATPRVLEVRVVDATRAPVEATVRLVNNHLSLEQRAERGLAVVRGLTPGSVLVSAATTDRAAAPQAIRLVDEVTSVTLVLEAGGFLAVSVLDERGGPATMPTVNLLTPTGEVLSRRALKTGELALLGPVALGDYELFVKAEGYASLRTPARVVEGETPLEVTLSAGTVISGAVLDEYGRPAPGVSVLLTPLGESTLSGPTGAFQATVPSPGQYLLQAHHSDWGGVERTVNAPAVGVSLQLEPRAGCAITATSGGKRVEGASAVLFTPEGSFRSDRVSGADGVVLMRGLPAGAYSLVVSHPDLLPSPRQPVTLVDGQLVTASAELAAGARIEGRVIDEAGVPVGGVSVTIAPRAAEPATTDTLGHFAFRPVRPNSVHTVKVTSRDYEQLEVVSTVAGSAPVTITVRRFATFRGKVLGAGQPLKRFRVDSHEVTSSDGTFELPLPAVGDHVIVMVDAPGHEPLTANRPKAFDLGVFDLRRLALMTGRVRDEAGPVADAVVSCDSCEQPALTDTSGRFVLPKPHAQREVHLFARKGRASATKTVSAEATDQLELVLQPAVKVSGSVWLDQGRPAPGVEVSALHAERNEHTAAVTDAAGAFSLELAEGTYRFTVSGGGLRRLSVDPQVLIAKVGPGPTRLDFGPAPGTVGLRVRVQPKNGHALWLVQGALGFVGNPPLELLRAPWAQMLFQPTTEFVTLSGIPPGRYTVVWASFYAADSSPPVLVVVDVPAVAELDVTQRVRGAPGGAP